MADSITDAIRAVWAAADGADATVLDHVPTPDTATSPAVMVDLNGLTWTPETVTVPIRLFVRASQHGDVRDAQLLTAELADNLETELAAVSLVTTGTVGYIEVIDSWAVTILASFYR